MKRTLPALALLLLLAAFATDRARLRTADAGEEAAVRQTAQWYLDAGDTRNPDLLHRAFHPDADLRFVTEAGYTKLAFAEWAARVAQQTGPVQTRRAAVTSVDVTGDAAVAKVVIETETMVVTDYLSLLKVDGDWKIVGKIFTRAPR